MIEEEADGRGSGGVSRVFLFAVGLLMALAVGLGVGLGLRLKGGAGLAGLSGGAGDCGQTGVAAVVDGQMLTEGDLDVEMAVQAVLQAQLGQAPSQDPAQMAMLRREITGQMVDQRLIHNAALKAGQNGDLNDLGRLVQSFNLTPDAFRQQMTARGIAAPQLDTWILRQSANARLVEAQGQPGLTPEKMAATLFPAADVQLCVGGQAQRPVQVGKLAPDFDLVGPDGKPGKLSDYRGKSVVLNFWATWCTPCKMEMPNLARTHTAFASQLTVLGVSSEETPGTVQAFLGQNPLPFPILLDQNGDVSRQYRVRGLPTTFFINPEGIVLDQKGGAFTNPAQLQPYIDRLLASVQP